jgi:hypothetical protein
MPAGYVVKLPQSTAGVADCEGQQRIDMTGLAATEFARRP